MDRIETLFYALRDDMLSSAQREGEQWRGRYTPGKLRVWRKSFMIGYVMRITQRLVQAEKQAAREAGALVLYKTDEQRARERMLEVFPEVMEEHKPIGGELDEVGYLQGQAWGDRAGIA